MKKYRAVVFCDFDGTITERETFMGTFERFAPTLTKEILPKILSKEVTLREGIKQLFQSMPSSIYPDELLTFVQDTPIRKGLRSLIDYLDSRQIPFIVISNAVRCAVETILKRENLLERCSKIYGIDVDTSEKHLKVISKWEAGNELVAKVDIIRQECQNNEKVIYIGDSISDLNASRFADIVFARDKLCQYLKEENIEFIEWIDFDDIKAKLQMIEDRFLF